MSDGRMLYWEQLAWLNGAKSENSEMVLQYIWPGCIRIPACCFTAKENDDYEKKGLLEFALFRTNLCRYLYNNSKEISTRLQKEVNNYTKV